MARDADDSSGLEHRQTRKVPDQTTAELMRELEGEVTNPRARIPRRGATYTALVPPPAQTIPGAEQYDAADDEATAAFEAPPDVPARRREWVRWAVIVGSGLAIVLLGLGAWSSFVKEREKQAAAAAQVKPAAKQPAPMPTSPQKAATKQASPAPAQPADPPAPAKEAPTEPEPVPPAGNDPTGAAPEDADTGSGEAAEPIDADVVAKALKGRKIRELDRLLVSKTSGKKRSFAKAEAYCENLEVAGIAGWRLPEIGELFSLSGARLVRRHVFWSRTVGDAGGERRLTWNAKRKRIRPLPPKWRGGRTVCVRERP